MPQPRRAPEETPSRAGQAGAATAATATAIPPAGAAVSAAAIAATVAAAIGGLRRFWFGPKSDDIFWLFALLKREFPAEAEDDLRKLARLEARYGEEFVQKMEARIERDLPRALVSSNDPEAALRTMLERERRYIRQRQEAMLSRSISTQERESLKRVSPAGAYWKLSPFVKSHTIDCLVMAGKFWPWEVLDVIHPPRHANCPCRLYGEAEAVGEGFLPPDFVPPPAEDGIALARELQERFAELREAVARSEEERQDGRGWDEVDELVELMEEHRVGLNLSEARREPKRFDKGTVKGGEFMPKTGGFAAKVKGDITKAVDALLRTGKGRGRGGKAKHGSLAVQHAPSAPPAPPPASVAHMSGAHGPLAAHQPTVPHRVSGPPNFEQFRGRVQDGVDAAAERYGAKVGFNSFDVDPSMPDTAAARWYDGTVEIGQDAPGAVEAARANPDDPEAQRGVYLAYSRAAHEAVGHGVNPIGPAEYATPDGFVLEEALAEEVGRDEAKEWLKADGLSGAADWAEANPDHGTAIGSYAIERSRLSALLDEAGVDEAHRRGLIETMGFRQNHAARMNLLGGLVANNEGLSASEGRERVRATLVGVRDDELGITGDFTSRLPVLPAKGADPPSSGGDQAPVEGGAANSVEAGAEAALSPQLAPSDTPGDKAGPVTLKKGSGPRFFDARHYSDPRRSLLKKMAALPYGPKGELDPENSLTLADGSTVKRGPKGSMRMSRPGGETKLYSTPQRLANAETAGILTRHGIGGDRLDAARAAAGVPAPEGAEGPSGYQAAPPERGAVAERVLGKARDTRDKHTVFVEGVGAVYTPERQALHAEIMDHFLGDATPPEGTPRVLFTAGAPGSGKSTILKGVDVPPDHVEVNPDAIKEMLPEFQELAAARDPFTGAAVHEESSTLASELRRRAQDAGLNIVVDGVGNSVTGKFKRKLTEFHNAGYEVEAVVAHLPVEEGRKRVAERAERSGRTVPEDIVSRYYQTVPKRFAEYAEAPWLKVSLYDTNVPRGEAPKLVASKAPGEAELAVADPAALGEFEALGRIGAHGQEHADLDRLASRRGGLLGGTGSGLPGGPDAGAAGGGGSPDVAPEVLAGEVLSDQMEGTGEVLWTPLGNTEITEDAGGWHAALLDRTDEGGDPERLFDRTRHGLADLISAPQRAPEDVASLQRSLSEKPPAAVLGTPSYSAAAAGLTDFKPAGGSNGAQMAKDADGNPWLVKPYRGNVDRVATEALANAVYRELGIDVPNAGIMDDTPGAAPGETPWKALAYPARDGEIKPWSAPNQELGEGFMADALTGNWDFVGLEQDNILWDAEGHPIRLDQGGTFEFRAMGKSKPYGPVPTEAWTLRSPMGQAFGRAAVNDQMLRDQAADIHARLTPDRVDALVDGVPFADEAMRERVRENLKARVAYMGGIADGTEELPGPLQGAEADQNFASDRAKLGELAPEEDAAIEHVLNSEDANDSLRSGERTPEAQQTVEALDEVFSSVRSSEDAYVHMPTTVEALGAGDTTELQGKVLRDRGYIVGSTDMATAAANGGAVIRVLVPAGAPVLGLGDLSTEPGAVLFNRGVGILISGAAQDGGTLVIDAVMTR